MSTRLRQKDHASDSDGHPRIGRYALLERLGTEHKHAAYRAVDIGSGFTVFLKLRVRNIELSGEEHRVLDEVAKRLMPLGNPHLVHFLDAGKETGFTYTVTSFVRGESLAQIVNAHGPLPESALARCALGLASALDTLHRFGLLHGGMAPDHVMIRRDGVAKLCDLSQVRAAGRIDAQSAYREMAAVRQYTSPEALTPGLPIDRRTDYYGLGATLYFAATGVSPFKATTKPEHLPAVIRKKRPPSPRRKNKQLSPEVSKLILSLLAKTPAERPSTLEDIGARLQSRL